MWQGVMSRAPFVAVLLLVVSVTAGAGETVRASSGSGEAGRDSISSVGSVRLPAAPVAQLWRACNNVELVFPNACITISNQTGMEFANIQPGADNDTTKILANYEYLIGPRRDGGIASVATFIGENIAAHVTTAPTNSTGSLKLTWSVTHVSGVQYRGRLDYEVRGVPVTWSVENRQNTWWWTPLVTLRPAAADAADSFTDSFEVDLPANLWPPPTPGTTPSTSTTPGLVPVPSVLASAATDTPAASPGTGTPGTR
jgi:hypothetical protein